jgi:ribosomal protein S18 acetylase RimI-like enzyme
MTQIVISHPEQDHPAAPKENIFLALDMAGAFLGSASIHPYISPDLEPDHPHNIGVFFHTSSEIPLTDPVKEQILEKIYQRAAEIKSEVGSEKTRLYACYFSHQTDEIEFFLNRGFLHDESMLILERSNPGKFPEISIPERFSTTPSYLETDSGQDRFISAHKKIFGQHAYTPERLAEISREPGWRNITALSEEKIAGNIMLYQDDQDQKLGYIEDLFVPKDFRGQGLAQGLLSEGLKYLDSLGISSVRLELWSANWVARHLYQKFDFKVVEEPQIALGKYIT